MGDITILDRRSGEYFSFNRTGGVIFLCLLTSSSEDQAMSKASKVLAVELNELKISFQEFRNQLLTEEILIKVKL
ncbi:hypothetical protein SAMN05444392_11638 [Seinonella peptonophila]|uniref:Coenzyme PQQ synthesis protein D (PqqD) n=1 Tax=Seinonella peptonophila TaxID=112248 RepID=A0A1M5AWC3_9BACL|nr:hypothetical protein [Seinonella peptonophila]SHF34493.1 hypothetical protein SAMN05444392_11638 [Seinonella peptonophila]